MMSKSERGSSSNVGGRERFAGFGRSGGGICRGETGTANELARLVAGTPQRSGVGDATRGVCVRGQGSGYGDCAVNSGGVLWQLTERGIDVDPDRQVATISAAARLDDIYNQTGRYGLAIPVTPGTRNVSFGGMIAADVHGKNHHTCGSIGDHLEWIDVLHADGVILRHRRGTKEFRATVGGMGLTGAIVAGAVRLDRAPTPYIVETATRCNTFDAVVEEMQRADRKTFSVAWVDLSRRSGRGVVSTGEWADEHSNGTRRWRDVEFRPARVSVPAQHLNWITPTTVAAFNTGWWVKAGRRDGREHIVHAGSFFHPLDSASGWNHLYGRAGFIQYQFVVPDEQIDVVHRIVTDLTARGWGTPMVVLKRFGDGNDSMLSFPIRGWTLAVDLPAGIDGLERALWGYDDAVAEAGGRVYLAKDSCLRRTHLATMYPQLEQWKAVRDEMNPTSSFQSDLGRRLGLVDAVRRDGGRA